MTERQPASRLEALLRARQFAITAEITPPVSCEADDLLRKALPLAGLADAVNVTDGAGARAHLSAPIARAGTPPSPPPPTRPPPAPAPRGPAPAACAARPAGVPPSPVACP